jgi:hypothetical protein
MKASVVFVVRPQSAALASTTWRLTRLRQLLRRESCLRPVRPRWLRTANRCGLPMANESFSYRIGAACSTCTRSPRTGAPERLFFASPFPKTMQQITSDSRFLIVRSTNPKTGSDLLAIPMTGDKKPMSDAPEVEDRGNPTGARAASTIGQRGSRRSGCCRR